ncbi:MAG: hypothetical protein N2645_12740 [Clostridia bacterium]|nr:hypothetical protein [Clostridia bacterium]
MQAPVNISPVNYQEKFLNIFLLVSTIQTAMFLVKNGEGIVIDAGVKPQEIIDAATLYS